MDKNFKPEHTLFCRELRFVATYAFFFWRYLGIKSAFLGKNSTSILYYFTELNSKIWDYGQKRRISRKNCNYALDERFHGHVCPRRKPANSCHPEQIPFFFNIAIISHQSSKSTFGGNKDTSWKCRGKFFVRLMSGGGNPQSLIVADDVDNKQWK